MKALINTRLINTLQTTGTSYDVRDTRLQGFIIRVNAGGSMNYVCQLKRGRRKNIGSVELFTPAQARAKAKEMLGDAIRGIYPNEEAVKKQGAITLKAFIEENYSPWSQTHHKSSLNAINRIKRCFFNWLGERLIQDISPVEIEQWRTSRLKAGRTSGTVNRDIARLKAALSKAVDWEFLEKNPLASIKPLKEDTKGKVRYLSKDEEKRLLAALDQREEKLRQQRDSANRWRQERGYPLLADLNKHTFADYIKPMVLLSINTGLRQGELFSLTWNQIDFEEGLLTVEGGRAKSGKTRHIYLNSEAKAVFKDWHQQACRSDTLVFPNKAGKRLNNVRKSWIALLKSADIENFRWHDMRHHFASKLVMLGVDLNTVRELLGHASLVMTLRYAHLAPEHKARAVEKLVTAQTETE